MDDKMSKPQQNPTFMSIHEEMMVKLNDLNNVVGLSINILEKLKRQPDVIATEPKFQPEDTHYSVVELFQKAVVNIELNIKSLNSNLNEILNMIE